MTTIDVPHPSSEADIPMARVLPAPPLTLADVLKVAIEQLEEFVLDVYEHGRGMGDPTVLWANGAPDLLRIVLDGSPLARRAVA